MVDIAAIAEHMEVVGSDGQHVGTVDRIEGQRIKLTRSDAAAGGAHHFIGIDLVLDVGKAVTLRIPAIEALKQAS